jgi:hypothetical protein
MDMGWVRHIPQRNDRPVRMHFVRLTNIERPMYVWLSAAQVELGTLTGASNHLGRKSARVLNDRRTYSCGNVRVCS